MTADGEDASHRAQRTKPAGVRKGSALKKRKKARHRPRVVALFVFAPFAHLALSLPFVCAERLSPCLPSQCSHRLCLFGRAYAFALSSPRLCGVIFARLGLYWPYGHYGLDWRERKVGRYERKKKKKNAMEEAAPQPSHALCNAVADTKGGLQDDGSASPPPLFFFFFSFAGFIYFSLFYILRIGVTMFVWRGRFGVPRLRQAFCEDGRERPARAFVSKARKLPRPGVVHYVVLSRDFLAPSPRCRC